MYNCVWLSINTDIQYQSGYDGDHCEERVKLCEDSSCAGGSTCVNTPRGHICVCPVGATGPTCGKK